MKFDTDIITLALNEETFEQAAQQFDEAVKALDSALFALMNSNGTPQAVTATRQYNIALNRLLVVNASLGVAHGAKSLIINQAPEPVPEDNTSWH